MNFKELFEKVYDRADLTVAESRDALLAMMNGDWETSQISAFLTALHMKGEIPDELAGFVLAMREQAVRVPVDDRRTLDTCGTGGDKKGSFNISTIAAFVLAGCGIPVAKHGNRASSSSCGSADLLEHLGIRCRLNPDEAAQAIDTIGFAFLFAPDYHPATKSVAAIRKQLAVPTLFNLLGPLTNPAFPAAQLIGVYDGRALPLMSAALQRMESSNRIILLHSSNGWDEATLDADFTLYPTYDGPSTENARAYGFGECAAEDLCGGSPAENVKIAQLILEGQRGPKRDTVLLNAALAYTAFHAGASRQQALAAVTESLDSGAARNVVSRLRERFPK